MRCTFTSCENASAKRETRTVRFYSRSLKSWRRVGIGSRTLLGLKSVSLFSKASVLSEAMKRVTLGLVLFASGCSSMDGLHVTAYQTVYGAFTVSRALT